MTRMGIIPAAGAWVAAGGFPGQSRTTSPLGARRTSAGSFGLHRRPPGSIGIHAATSASFGDGHPRGLGDDLG